MAAINSFTGFFSGPPPGCPGEQVADTISCARESFPRAKGGGQEGDTSSSQAQQGRQLGGRAWSRQPELQHGDLLLTLSTSLLGEGQGEGCRLGKYRLKDRSSLTAPSGGADERSTPYSRGSSAKGSGPFYRVGEGRSAECPGTAARALGVGAFPRVLT